MVAFYHKLWAAAQLSRAAKDLGMCAIGIEIEERYCEIAVERLRQSSLFDDLPEPDAHDELPVLFVE